MLQVIQIASEHISFFHILNKVLVESSHLIISPAIAYYVPYLYLTFLF